MGSKGSVKNYERPLSEQELALYETQNQAMLDSIDIARQAENRSQDQYDNWKNTYQGIETGNIPFGASRANGYQDPRIVAPNPQLFNRQQPQMMQRDNQQAMAQYQSAMKNGKGA